MSDKIENLIIFDVRGIQKYIYRSKKIKEVIGASNIVRNLLSKAIKEYCKDNNIVFTSWCDENNIFEFKFFNLENLNKDYIECVYEGGGNLLLATRLSENDTNSFTKYLQRYFLENSYSLSLGFATMQISKDIDYINKAYPEIKAKLNEVKKRMPQLSLAKPLPICEVDSNTGFAMSIVKNDQPSNKLNNHFSIESSLKLDNYIKSENNEIDRFFSDEEIEDNSLKTLIAIVHIDGNDMGGIISSYMKSKRKDNMSFEDGVKISRELSYKINKVFKSNVEGIIDRYEARTIINSGDDITYICRASDAFSLTKEIMRMIEQNYLGDDKNNIFTSCAGIAFTHRHFPFHKAYEIAEECCSLAKKQAKKEENKFVLNLKEGHVTRPSSYIDFEIIKSGIIKSVASKRNENSYLYLRPYLVSIQHENITLNSKYYNIEDLLNDIKNLREANVSRNAVKEIRNTYESSKVETKILFLRLKSRNNLGSKFNYDEPFDTNGKARYYDGATLIDIVSKGEE